MATIDEETPAFEESDLVTLGEKLASLDLTEPERAALAALVSDDDVGGFGRYGSRFDILGGIRKGMGFRRQQDPLGKRAGVRANNLTADWAVNVQPPKPGRF